MLIKQKVPYYALDQAPAGVLASLKMPFLLIFASLIACILQCQNIKRTLGLSHAGLSETTQLSGDIKYRIPCSEDSDTITLMLEHMCKVTHQLDP